MTSLARRSLYILYPQSWPPARHGLRAKATITNTSRARQRRGGGGEAFYTPVLGRTSIPGTSIPCPSTRGGISILGEQHQTGGTSILHPRATGDQHPGDQQSASQHLGEANIPGDQHRTEGTSIPHPSTGGGPGSHTPVSGGTSIPGDRHWMGGPASCTRVRGRPASRTPAPGIGTSTLGTSILHPRAGGHTSIPMTSPSNPPLSVGTPGSRCLS